MRNVMKITENFNEGKLQRIQEPGILTMTRRR